MSTVVQGLIDFYRSAVTKPSDLETSDRIIFASGISLATCNCVLEKHPGTNIHPNDIQKAVQFFKERNLPFVWWTDNKCLEKEGFRFAGSMKGIKWDSALYQPQKLDVEVVMVNTPQEFEDFSEVYKGYGA